MTVDSEHVYKVVHLGGSTIVIAYDWDALIDGPLFFYDEDDEVCGYWPRGTWYGVIDG